MKKTLIVLILLLAVHAGAATTITGGSLGNDSQTADFIDNIDFTGGSAGFNTTTGGSFGNDKFTGDSIGNDTFTGGSLGNDSNTAGNIMLGGNGGLTPGSSNLNMGSSNAGVSKISFEGILNWVISIMNKLVYVIIALALVAFLYGILKLAFIDGTKPEAREQARKFMFWGIISLFVMVSTWGLVRVLQYTFFGNGNLIAPQFKK